MTSRRTFCKALATSALAKGAAGSAGTTTPRDPGPSLFGVQNCPTEWAYTTDKQYSDPFNDVDLDIVITTPSGETQRVPAFWDGGSAWRVRYAPPTAGRYTYRSVCTDSSNENLHGRAGTLTAVPYTGGNSLYRHGAIQVAEDKRHFQQRDGSPFFWLGDTWWMGLCKRLRWPDDFQTLTADRVRKNFSVVQIVAGLYPDMDPFDPRGANEAGFPWLQNYSAINPAYFDMADLRIQHLTDRGIAPCIVGCWGYFLPIMGIKKMKQHWRYLIARWGAYPVIWCLAGEATMPFYLSKTRDQDAETQKQGWTELARYVRATDPYHHPITLHPSRSARDSVTDPTLIDFDMLQTGHDDRQSVPNTINSLNRSLASTPKMPALVGEVCYEGIQQASWQEVQRFMFWSCILSGAGGHTYGANGVWQVNAIDHPYGLSPHGHSWGGPPWEEASQLPGSGQLGLAKSLLSRYSWWKLEARQDFVEPHWTPENYWQPFAAQIPGEAIIAFCPTGRQAIQFRHLEARRYRGFFFNLSDATETSFGSVQPDATGALRAPEFPIFRDWIIVLDAKG